MKISTPFLLLLMLLSGFCLAQTKSEKIIVEKINRYRTAVKKDKDIKQYEFEIVGKNKVIHYQYQKKRDEIISISRSWDEAREEAIDTYSDYFLLKKGIKVYGTQGESFKMKSDPEISGGWFCQFWFDKNKVMDMTSIGHGKTELDDWNYEKEFKENFEYMMKTVKDDDKKR